jgi:glucose-6-phosphate 1-dehydrogenase
MKAGKALNERKVEIRVQYKPPAAGIYAHLNQMRNELVVCLPRPVTHRLSGFHLRTCFVGPST